MSTESPETPDSRPPGALRWAVLLLALPVVALAVWFGVTIFRTVPPPALDVGDTATVLRAPLPLPDFTLSDHNGAAFDAARFDGHWSFVFFGYTFCPDVCPMTLSTFKAVAAQLADQADLQFVFVSVDPERDSLDRLAEFVPYFQEDFLGVTGAPEQIARLTSGIGVYHRKADGEASPDYLMDHSTAVMLVDPQHRLAAIFGTPHDPEAIAEAFRKIRAHGSRP